MEFSGSQAAKGVVGSLLVVVEHPPPHRLANILEVSEEVLVEPQGAPGILLNDAPFPPVLRRG